MLKMKTLLKSVKSDLIPLMATLDSVVFGMKYRVVCLLDQTTKSSLGTAQSWQLKRVSFRYFQKLTTVTTVFHCHMEIRYRIVDIYYLTLHELLVLLKGWYLCGELDFSNRKEIAFGNTYSAQFFHKVCWHAQTFVDNSKEKLNS